VRHLVRGEGDVRVLEEALGDEVAEGVIFFVEGEDLGVGDLWRAVLVEGCVWCGEITGRTGFLLGLDLRLTGVEDKELEPVVAVIFCFGRTLGKDVLDVLDVSAANHLRDGELGRAAELCVCVQARGCAGACCCVVARMIEVLGGREDAGAATFTAPY
jgi:hypothetical protein